MGSGGEETALVSKEVARSSAASRGLRRRVSAGSCEVDGLEGVDAPGQTARIGRSAAGHEEVVLDIRVRLCHLSGARSAPGGAARMVPPRLLGPFS